MRPAANRRGALLFYTLHIVEGKISPYFVLISKFYPFR